MKMRNGRELGARAVAALVVFCVALVSQSAPSRAVASQGFRLVVDDVSGLDEPWPLLGGLPFPQGVIEDASRIRVMRGGQEVPAQVDVVSRWRDGSIRWALAGLVGSPQAEYRVEFGDAVSRREPEAPLRIEGEADGAFSVDTGAAAYGFSADGLLPQWATVGGVPVIEDSADGAYLLDNRGRLARVAGAAAEIETEVLHDGPVRTVIRRQGWYVASEGERVARARVWFYLAAGSPHLRVTHSLIFTEDTNDLWARDYGLEFRTPEAPREAVFSVSEAAPEESYGAQAGGRGWTERRGELANLFHSGLYEREQRLFAATPDGGEVYMLQDRYPHVLERDFRAVIGRGGAGDMQRGVAEAFWADEWLLGMDVAGDWAEARFDGRALAVVVPQLAQQFPKEIAIGPGGARVALWSGRTGRELDLRAVTLVNEYWQRWGEAFENRVGRGPLDVEGLAREPSNAQGAARTHDIWLMPRAGSADEQALLRRAAAASHTPLLRADPAWLCATEAIGWPMRPRDTERFADVESVLTDEWEFLMGGPHYNAGLRRTGFVMWGKYPNLRGHRSWFRLSHYVSGDYGFHRHVWLLYARGGDRALFEYGSRFNRWQADWDIVHWSAGGKFKGEHVAGPPYRRHLPFYWGMGASELPGERGRIRHWLMQYWLTGDEYALETMSMIADAYRQRWNDARDLSRDVSGHIHILSGLLALEQDATLAAIAERVAHHRIDLDNPMGLNDDVGYGVHYKTTRELLPLYFYYEATGDEVAREAILKAMEYKFRFNIHDRTGLAGRRHGLACQHKGTFLWSIAYLWTGDRAFLRMVNNMIEHTRTYEMGHRFGPIINQMNPFMGVPTALYALADIDEPIEPYPLLAVRAPERVPSFDGNFRTVRRDAMPPVLFRKEDGAPVTLRLAIRLADEMDADAVPRAELAALGGNGGGAALGGVEIELEPLFISRTQKRLDPRRWLVSASVPADAPAGEYRLEFPDAGVVAVLESSAPDIWLPPEE